MKDRKFTYPAYDSTPLKSEPLYTITDDKAIFPITTKYTLTTPIFYSFHHKEFTGSNYNVLIENFMTNEDMLFEWINNLKCSSSGFKIIEAKSIQVLKYENDDIFDFDISSETLFTEDETVAIITGHPAFQTLKERAEEIAKENEKIAIKEFNDRRNNVKQNQYLTWKHLNEKYLEGEFEEFEETKEIFLNFDSLEQ